MIDNILRLPDGAGDEGEGARLGRVGRPAAPDRRGEPVAEVQVRNQVLAAGGKEASSPQPSLELVQSTVGLVDLERRPHRRDPVPGAAARPILRVMPLRTTVPTRASV